VTDAAQAHSSSWARKDLIGIEPLAREEIEAIFDRARRMKEVLTSGETIDPLRGRILVNLFVEPSTRTRMGFEIAARKLGAETVTIAGDASSLVKGETLRDTAQVIQALQANLLVVRHSTAGAPRYLSDQLDIPIVNAGDGAHEHPTQALLDAFTLTEHWGSLEGRRIAILGDILFSRVARSNIWTLTRLGAKVTLVGPSTLVPKAFEKLGVTVRHKLRNALGDQDAVMLLRIQHERQSATHFPSLGEYRHLFGLNADRLGWLKKDAIIMHPGPINRGVELDSALADGPRSVVLEQVTNGVAIRMAVLQLCHDAALHPVSSES
jgi:aspartate carbamoyltransferase catalytic subunit